MANNLLAKAKATQKPAKKEEEDPFEDDNVFGDDEPVPVKKKPTKKKPAKKKGKPKKKAPTNKRGKVVLINGYEGSGKSTAAGTFESPFFICLEKGKFLDLVEYPPEIAPEFEHFEEKKDYIIANADDDGEEDKQATYDTILKYVEWFKDQDEKKTLVFDTAKALWDIAWGRKEQEKGRKLGKPEFIPITSELKSWVLDLVHWCRKYGRNLVFTSHTTGIYKDIDEFTTLQIGEQPDAKYWIREAVSWRIDMLKPETSGFDNRFIAFFSKAPGKQYFYIDLTGKRLFDVISNKESLAEAIVEFETLQKQESEDEIFS